MVLETPKKLCVTESGILEKPFLPQKLGKWAKNRPKIGFLNLKKNLDINFYWICSIRKIYIFAVFLHKSCIWQKSCSWGKGQNALSESDCRIFKLSFSPEQIDETASFFACHYEFTKIKNCLKFFSLSMVKI